MPIAARCRFVRHMGSLRLDPPLWLSCLPLALKGMARDFYRRRRTILERLARHTRFTLSGPNRATPLGLDNLKGASVTLLRPR